MIDFKSFVKTISERFEEPPLNIMTDYCLFEDWGDYCSEQGIRWKTGDYIGNRASLIRGFRPVWKCIWTQNRALTMGRGYISCPDGSEISTECKCNAGIWYVRLLTRTQSPYNTYIKFMFIDGDNYMSAVQPADHPWRLMKRVGGTSTYLIKGSQVIEPVPGLSKIKVTRRDDVGHWELFRNDISEGTAVDSSIKRSEEFRIYNNYDSKQIYEIWVKPKIE